MAETTALVAPILTPCEGSDHLTHFPAMNSGICAMCGVTVTCRDDGTAWPHERNDIIAMLERGDFDGWDDGGVNDDLGRHKRKEHADA